MPELIEELQGYIMNGRHYPQFPARANPMVLYAYDLNEQEDADIYGEVINELNKINEREVRDNAWKDSSDNQNLTHIAKEVG